MNRKGNAIVKFNIEIFQIVDRLKTDRPNGR